MMKRLLIFMQMLIAFAAGVSAQETLTVCDGTNTNASLPFAGAYNQDGAITSQMIYPAADLTAMNGKKITSITFYPTSVLGWTNVNTWKLAEVEQTTFSSAALLSVTTTQVASTRGTKNADNSWTIEFSTPYVYNGGNLMIQGEMPQGYDGNQTFYGVNQSGYTSFVSTSYDTYRERFLPKVTFTYEDNDGGDTGGGSTAYAGPATFDFIANPWNHGYGYFDKIELTDETSGATLVFDKGLGGQLRYRDTNKNIYIYPNNEVTLTAPTGSAISAITVTPYANDASLLGISNANITFDEPVTSYQFEKVSLPTGTTAARWTKVEVTLVKVAGGDAGGYVIPEGYHETTDWADSFEKAPSTISATSLWPGWGYTSSGTATTGFFNRNNGSSAKHTGSYGIYLGDKRSAANIDYLVTPALKGDVKMWIRAYSTYTAGAYYMRFYEVTENEDGTFVLGDLVKEITPESTTYAQYDIATLSDYTRLAVTGSYVYFDDITASYAVIPDDIAMTVTNLTSVTTGNLYADMEGKATYKGTFRVKNVGNVDLVPSRQNYSVTVTSNATVTTIPETIIPLDVTLAPGEESADIPFEVVMSFVNNNGTDAYTGIRVTSNLLPNGTTATTSGNYQVSPWFYLKTVAPQLEVRNSSSFKMAENTTELGLVDAPASTTLQFRSLGGSPVILKDIVTTCPGVEFTVDGEALTFPYTIDKNVEKEFTLTFTKTGGQSTTLDFVYGNNYDDSEYHYVTKAVSAVVKDASLYFEDFDGYLTVPAGWCQPGWINEDGSNWSFDSSSSNTYAKNGTQSYPNKKLISPKVSFAEGQSLTISATPNGNSTSSSADYYLKVWYSADRLNWTLANVVAKTNYTTYESVKDVPAEKIISWPNLAKSYSIALSDFDPIVITGIPAGDWYIGFEAGYSSIDYIFGGQLAAVDNDLYINSYDVKAEPAMVNYPVTATVKYTNMLGTAAAPRTVALYDGETLIEEKAGTELEGYASETVEFTFTPHAAGEMNLKVKVANTGDDYSVETLAKTLTISEESMIGEVAVGEKTTSQGTPLGSNYNKYRGEWIWTADKIGLEAGAVITSVTLKYSNTNKNMIKKVKAYLMSTEDEQVSGTKFTPVAELTPNYSNDEFAMNMNETDLVFTLSAPYTYDGKNIRVVFDFDGTNFANTYFDCYPGRSLYYRNDNNAATDATSATTGYYIPVGKLGISVTAPVLSGTITAEEVALEGATVEAKSGNVIYTATTDAEGKYSMEIMQPTLEYVVTVKAEGYADYVSEAMTIDENKTFDHDFLSGAVVNINPEIGYATFYDSKHAVKIPEGAEAYIFTQTLEGGLGIVEFGMILESFGAYDTYEGVIPAGEPVVIKAAGDVTLKYVSDPEYNMYNYLGTDVKSLSEIGLNRLCGTDEAAMTTAPAVLESEDDDCYFYALTLNKSKDPKSVGFYWMNETGAAFMNKAHKAYLVIPQYMFETEAKSAFLFNDDATGIKNVNVNRNDNKMFNIAGQRVNGNVKGIVIKNGKKFMVK